MRHDVRFYTWMIFPVHLASFSEVQTPAAFVLVAVVSFGMAWWMQQRKLKQMLARHEQECVDLQTFLNMQKTEAANEAALAQQRLDEANAERSLVEERFALHRDAAQRRETDSLARISALESDLAINREIGAQLVPTQARIGDLETALTSERGRVNALEQALAVTNTRALELGQQLQETKTRFTALHEKSRLRELELTQQLSEREQSLASDQARLGNVDDEITRLKETHAAYQSTAEMRIAGLQRQLAAAEAKSAMVQKEFMSAVGVLPESPLNPAAPNDKRVSELETKISQIEAEARKKAREDGYKIAELEYRLSEATDAVAQFKLATDRATEVETLRSEVKSLSADKEALMQDIETLKLIQGRSVEPVPEVLEQSLLPIDEVLQSE